MRAKMLYHLDRAGFWLNWLLSKAGGLDAQEAATARREVRAHLLMCWALRAA